MERRIMLKLLSDIAEAITTDGGVRQLDADNHVLPCYSCPAASCFGCEFQDKGVKLIYGDKI
jgi:hypothetical protein